MYAKGNTEARSCNHCCSGKAASITYFECVTLGVEHATRIRLITLSSVACPTLQYFSTLSNKRHDVQKKVIENKMCLLIFPTNFA